MSRKKLPDHWVSAIFKRMEGRYGSMFLDRWRGCDMQNVRNTWAEELGGFADEPESIAYALNTLATSKFPPTLPEFIEACRRAPPKEVPMLQHKLTPEDIERNKARLNEIMASLTKHQRMEVA